MEEKRPKEGALFREERSTEEAEFAHAALVAEVADFGGEVIQRDIKVYFERSVQTVRDARVTTAQATATYLVCVWYVIAEPKEEPMGDDEIARLISDG